LTNLVADISLANVILKEFLSKKEWAWTGGGKW